MSDKTKPILLFQLTQSSDDVWQNKANTVIPADSVQWWCLTKQSQYCYSSGLSPVMMSDKTKPILLFQRTQSSDDVWQNKANTVIPADSVLSSCRPDNTKPILNTLANTKSHWWGQSYHCVWKCSSHTKTWGLINPNNKQYGAALMTTTEQHATGCQPSLWRSCMHASSDVSDNMGSFFFFFFFFVLCWTHY